MTRYSATIGVFVRAYGSFDFEAPNDESAVQAAIAEFRENQQFEMSLGEIDWNNKALPSLVSIINEDDESDVSEGEGVDFALNADDSRDLASRELLAALESLLDTLEEQLTYDAKENPDIEDAIAAGAAAIAKAKGS